MDLLGGYGSGSDDEESDTPLVAAAPDKQQPVAAKSQQQQRTPAAAGPSPPPPTSKAGAQQAKIQLPSPDMLFGGDASGGAGRCVRVYALQRYHLACAPVRLHTSTSSAFPQHTHTHVQQTHIHVSDRALAARLHQPQQGQQGAQRVETRLGRQAAGSRRAERQHARATTAARQVGRQEGVCVFGGVAALASVMDMCSCVLCEPPSLQCFDRTTVPSPVCVHACMRACM